MVGTVEKKSIREAVAENLANLSERTRNEVVEHFAAMEAKKQATAIIKGLDKLAELEKERSRIKPVPTAFNLDGTSVGEPSFTKEQVEQNKKLTEQIEKLTKAIDKADNNADFGDLYNLTK